MSKPTALIVGAASGLVVYESPYKVMTTVMANIPDNCRLLISGANGKIVDGQIEPSTSDQLDELAEAFYQLITEQSASKQK